MDSTTAYLITLAQTYWQAHGIIGVLAAWVVVSGLLNLLFRIKSPADWITWAQTNPKGKAIVDLIRGWGFDPVALLDALQVYSQKKSAAAEVAVQQSKGNS